MKKIITRKIIVRELKIWLAASIIGVILALAIATHTQAYSQNIQNEISQNVIRFHVLANSNAAEDQALKNMVRDGILNQFGSKLDPTSNIEDTRFFLQNNMTEIEAYAVQLIKNEGFNYSVQGVIDQTFFPTRKYGNMAFPAGEYEALRIIIGEGQGDNWWCVMFPPLCYVDGTTANPTSDDYTLLRNLLSDETYALMNHAQGGTSVTVRFKIVEWWQEHMQQAQQQSLYAQK